MSNKKLILIALMGLVLFIGAVGAVVVMRRTVTPQQTGNVSLDTDRDTVTSDTVAGEADVTAVENSCGNGICEDTETLEDCYLDCHPVPLVSPDLSIGGQATFVVETRQPIKLNVEYGAVGSTDTIKVTTADEVSDRHEFTLMNLVPGQLYNICYMASDANGRDFDSRCDEFVAGE